MRRRFNNTKRKEYNKDKSPLKSINNNRIAYNRSSLSICKIEYVDKNNYLATGTGFFIKFKDPKDEQKYKYFLMTCEHVIEKDMINKGNYDITVKYFYEGYNALISINKNERFVKEYKSNFDLDITIIEINPEEDNIPTMIFLEPNYDLNVYNIDKLVGKFIAIHQYPLGCNQKYSEGKITYIEKKIFKHSSSTETGSSGSPVMLLNKTEIIGIHSNGGNYGYFIYEIVEDIKNIYEVDYIYEKGKNTEFNYNAQNLIVTKNPNRHEFKKNNYKIVLTINSPDSLHIQATNVKSNENYETDTDLIFSDNLNEELKLYEMNIYHSHIFQFGDQLIIDFLDVGERLNLNKCITYNKNIDNLNSKLSQINISEEEPDPIENNMYSNTMDRFKIDYQNGKIKLKASYLHTQNSFGQKNHKTISIRNFKEQTQKNNEDNIKGFMDDDNTFSEEEEDKDLGPPPLSQEKYLSHRNVLRPKLLLEPKNKREHKEMPKPTYTYRSNNDGFCSII